MGEAPAGPAAGARDTPDGAALELAFGPRRRTRSLAILSLAALLVAAVIGLAVGAEHVPLGTVLRLILSPLLPPDSTAHIPAPWRTIVLELRLPRVLLMALIGAALAAAGATFQGLFRNPLADPYIIGVASGAGLGATVVITLAAPAGLLALFAVPLGAFLGGVLSVALVLLIARVGRSTPVTTLLLAGIAVASFTTSVTTFWMLRSDESIHRAFSWIVGGYSSVGWAPIAIVVPYLVIGLGALQYHARGLNALQFDEEQARQLGVHVERLKLWLLGVATLMTAAAVSFGGLLGFVGLVVPHVLRMLGGPDHRRLIPLSAVGGATFLILADVVARAAFAPEAQPVGVITALVGAPFFVFLLRRLKRSVF